MLFHETKQIVFAVKKRSFRVVILGQLRAGAELDAFKCAVIVFTIVLCHNES